MTTPDILDLHPNLPFILDFNSYSNKKSFSGKLVTVDCPDDNSLVKEILSTDGGGSVLFINGNDSKNVAFLGDNLALLGKQNNWLGLISTLSTLKILLSFPLPSFLLFLGHDPLA